MICAECTEVTFPANQIIEKNRRSENVRDVLRTGAHEYDKLNRPQTGVQYFP